MQGKADSVTMPNSFSIGEYSTILNKIQETEFDQTFSPSIIYLDIENRDNRRKKRE